jgi:hypothetical protein
LYDEEAGQREKGDERPPFEDSVIFEFFDSDDGAIKRTLLPMPLDAAFLRIAKAIRFWACDNAEPGLGLQMRQRLKVASSNIWR